MRRPSAIPIPPALAALAAGDSDDHRLMPRAEAATVLRCSERTISNMQKAGLLSYVKLGPRTVRCRRDEIVALATSGFSAL